MFKLFVLLLVYYLVCFIVVTVLFKRNDPGHYDEDWPDNQSNYDLAA